jgi:hypothetical protein
VARQRHYSLRASRDALAARRLRPPNGQATRDRPRHGRQVSPRGSISGNGHPFPSTQDRPVSSPPPRAGTPASTTRAPWKEIHAQGYPSSDIAVRRILASWRSPAPQPGVAGSPLPAKEEVIYYSTHKTRWLRSTPVEDLSEREAAYITALKQRCPPIADAQRLLATFRALLSTRHEEGLAPLVEQCEQSGISELVGFARGLRRDYAAAQAAVRYDWSQGPIEGHINRLKLLKRQMYGRAKFDLLRQRVLFQMAG